MAEINIDELAKKYQKFFQDEGYGCKDPEKDDRANTLDLVVKYEGFTFLLVLDYDDTEFVRIMLPNFYPIIGKIPEANLAVSVVAAKCKCAKAFLNNNDTNINATVEYLENGNSVTATQLFRYFGMLTGAAKVFAEAMQK